MVDKVFAVERIVVELSQYKHEKWVKRVQNRINGKSHLEFNCTILLKVDGRNLRWEVVNPYGEVLEGSRGQSNISAGFERGTE
jgi:hypothetical protein